MLNKFLLSDQMNEACSYKDNRVWIKSHHWHVYEIMLAGEKKILLCKNVSCIQMNQGIL